jgi:hypothetical protein
MLQAWHAGVSALCRVTDIWLARSGLDSGRRAPERGPGVVGGNAHAERGQVLLPWSHAFRSAAPYLAAPTNPSLARLPLVTGGLFSCRSRTDLRVRKSHDSRR